MALAMSKINTSKMNTTLNRIRAITAFSGMDTARVTLQGHLYYIVETSRKGEKEVKNGRS